MTLRPGRTIDPEAKRTAVLEAAVRLFARQGYGATTTASIAAEAGVATGTLFRFFPDKAALLGALHVAIETRFAEAMSAAWEAAPGHALERFEPMYRAIFDVAGEFGEAMPIMAMSVGRHEHAHAPGSILRPRIEAQYASAVSAGEFHGWPPAAVAHIVSGMVDGALRHWLERPTPQRRREALGTLTDLSRRTFAP